MPSRIVAVVLAAGLSRRMGSANKLMLRLEGRPLLHHALSSLLDSVDAVVVVTGHDRKAVETTLRSIVTDRNLDGRIRFVHNPDYEDGMGTSLATGVKAAVSSPDWGDVAGILIHLGDVPAVQPSTVRRLVDVFTGCEEPAVVIPVCEGRRGHPVLFDHRFAEELTALSGDTGAKPVLTAHPDALVEVEVDDSGIHRDVDTREAYDDLRCADRESRTDAEQ
jgi:molybdenum cofactor cytidylyltransferase